MQIDPRAQAIWARTRLLVWPETYRLVSFPPGALTTAMESASTSKKSFIAVVRERDEVSVTMEESEWRESPWRTMACREDGPYRAVTFDVNIDLDVCGYLAPAAELLADAGVSIIPQCAFLKDHILVHEKHLEKAVKILADLIDRCRLAEKPEGSDQEKSRQ